MFAGIVEEAAVIEAVVPNPNLTRLSVRSSLDHGATSLGDSIAIEGVCLTVVKKSGSVLDFEAVPETLRCSTLGELKAGARVNLERSLSVGERIHGHFVFGHVDSTVELLSRRPDGDCERYEWSLPPALRGYVAPKGSISIAGVSLTVGEVENGSFSVYIIPHTAQVTTLAERIPGSRANVEIDMLARYIKAAIDARGIEG